MRHSAGQGGNGLPGNGQDTDAGPDPRAERGDGLVGGSAPRLDKRTYLDREQGRYRALLRDYGGGLAEIGWSFVPNLTTFKKARGFSDAREINEDRASRRARSRLRQLILGAQADHLLTLTYRANVTDLRQACGDLRQFVRKVRRPLPAWVYIAVPERQERGAWHWHMAVCGRQDVNLLRAFWRQTVGEGNIDVQPPRGAGANRRLAIVKYLGKYLAKGFEDGDRLLNRHRYRASLGIFIPAELVELPEEHSRSPVSFALALLMQRAGTVGHLWQDENFSAGWACSWK